MFNYTQLEEEKVDYLEIAPASELPSGERLFVDIGDTPVGDVCTHDDGPLGDGDVENHTVVCPRHGAEFDMRTGKAMSMPAVVDIPAYPVQVRDGVIFVGIPK